MIFIWFWDGKYIQNGGPGDPKCFQKSYPKTNKGLRKGTPSQDPSKAGFGEGSGWIWGSFWEGFGRVWEPWGSPNAHENQYISKEIQVLPPGSPKGGFWEGLGSFGEGFGKVLEGFFGKLVGFSWGISGNPREGG